MNSDMTLDLSHLQQKLDDKTAIAAIIGLGYVGLPLAQAMYRKNMPVIGLDIDQSKIDSLMAGRVYIDGVDEAANRSAIKDKLFIPTCEFANLDKADFIVVCVPTPLDGDNNPDLSCVEQTMENVAKHLRKDQIVILESTTYPGTMRDVVIPILEKVSGLKNEKDFYVAYSPEREDPGNQNFDTQGIPKIVGANQPEILKLVENFYQIFIQKVVTVSSMEVAEAAKITENIFRAVNIAFVNELKTIYDKMDIDIWEVIDAAKTKPFGFMPFYPGPGIGGHCIPIDPFYLAWKAKEMGQETRFIELAGEINLSMSDYIIQKIEDEFGKGNKKLLMIGVAYKKNVSDQRESPAFPLMKKLLEVGHEIDFHDPYIPSILPSRQYSEFEKVKSIELSGDALKNYDAALIITDHDNVDYELLAEHSHVVIDTRNALRSRDIKSKAKLIQA